MTEEQVAGLYLSMEKGCAACHNGVNLGGNGYHPLGLIENPGGGRAAARRPGRFAVTETADDSYVLRASPLRNIDQTAPYFHSVKVWVLKVAVQIMGTSQLGTEIDDAEADRVVSRKWWKFSGGGLRAR